MGWDEINNKGKTYHDERIKRLTQLCRSIFSAGEGKEFITLLKDFYSLSPICVPGSPAGSNEIREGEANLLRKIIQWTKHVENNESKK